MDSEEWTRCARTALGPYDPTDLAAGIGGLQIAPENAGRLYGLEVAASVIAGLEPSSGRPPMTVQRWRKSLNEADGVLRIGVSFEEPFENPFVESLTFDGEAYLFLPGLEDESTFILRQLMRAVLLLGRSDSARRFVEPARRLCHAALAVGDAVCRRAGLERGLAPGSAVGVPVAVPTGGGFAVVKRAVSFTADELAEVLARKGLDPSNLEPLVSDQGASFPRAWWANSLPALGVPIVRTATGIVVIGPMTLVPRLRHALICLAADLGLVEAFARAYRAAVFESVTRSLSILGSDPLQDSVTADGDGVVTKGGFFGLDSDKVLHVLLVSDGLRGYVRSDPLGRWPLDGVPNAIESRLAAAERWTFAVQPAVSEMLHLVLIQGVGRFYALNPAVSAPSARSQRLMMTAGDLGTIALIEGGTRLRLWQFARAAARVRETSRVLRMSVLDEYDAWRAKGYGFYSGDDRRYNLVSFLPGGAGHLRREVQRERDFHGAIGHDPGSVVEVGRLHDDPAVPIYIPWDDLRSRVQVLAEVPSGPYWIVAPAELSDARYRHLYAEVADMLAYWLWQCDPGLTEQGLGVSRFGGPVTIHLEIERAPGWFSGDVEADCPNPVRSELRGAAELGMWLGPGMARLLESSDNSGERHILRVVLRALGQLVAAGNPGDDPLTDQRIEELVDRFAPLGLKKKFFLVPGHGDPRLDRRHLPPFRKVQEPDVEELLDKVGDFVASRLRLQPGPVPDDQRTTVLTEVVAFLFAELERLVSTLAPDELLEELVAFNEAIVRAQAKRQLTIPTQLACFGSTEALADQLRRQLPEASEAATASRVLTEYVTARPPQGDRRLSLASYDRLLALVSQIQSWAFTSDDIHFGLVDHVLELLPSGRLGVGCEDFLATYELFLGARALGEIGRSAEDFERHWVNPANLTGPAIDAGLERATAAEFGLPINKLVDFLWAVIQVGDRQSVAAKSANVDELLTELRGNLGWEEAEVRLAFELFAATPRPSFFHPPSPFVEKDAWPWNFNRALSYLRKPLLVRGQAARAEVIWGNRNVFLAGLTLVSLCSSARLKAHSPKMRRLIGKQRNVASTAFNDRVAELYRAVPGFVVRWRVKKVGRLKIQRPSGEELGDIDVLVADPSTRRLLAVDTKDLAAARTPAELHQEVKAVFESRAGRSADIDKHLERAAWLQDHRAEVLAALGLPADDATNWAVEPSVVVNLESMAPYLGGQRMKVLSVQELKRELGGQPT